jgi:hypothetical protein
VTFLICALSLGLAGGCAFGPKALECSHARYNEAVRLVSEEQLLRNIVHLRYTETPLDLAVASIAAQYELSGHAEARPFFLAPNPSNSNVIFKTFTAILPDLFVEAANRPTISLDPADDGAAVRRLLTPITADTLAFLIQTNWPVSTILRLWVERLNGVPNAVPASGPRRDVIPDFARFFRIVELMQVAKDRALMSVQPEERDVEVGGPLPEKAVTSAAVVEAAKNGMEYRPRGDGVFWVPVRRERKLVLEVHRPDAPEVAELLALLNLAPGRRHYEIAVTSFTPDPLLNPTPPSAELRVVPRSTAQVLFYLSNGVEVPPEHLKAGLIMPALDAEGRAFDARAVTRGLFEVHVCTGHKPPPWAYVAVKYRGYWYYIDDRDQQSKATFILVLQLSRLDFARQQPAKPLLTLPVGR